MLSPYFSIKFKTVFGHISEKFVEAEKLENTKAELKALHNEILSDEMIEDVNFYESLTVKLPF